MLLLDVKDPRIRFVTVTGAELTDDMSQAKIFVSLYGSEEEQQSAWNALNKAKGFLRSEIAKRIRLRFAPELLLVKDTSLAYGAHIEDLLRRIREDDAAAVEERSSGLGKGTSDGAEVKEGEGKSHE